MHRRLSLLLVSLVIISILGTCGCDTYTRSVLDILGLWYMKLRYWHGEWEAPEDNAQPGQPMTTYFTLEMRQEGTFETVTGELGGPEWVNETGTWHREDGRRYVLTWSLDPTQTVDLELRGDQLFAYEGRRVYRFTHEPIYWPTLGPPHVANEPVLLNRE